MGRRIMTVELNRDKEGMQIQQPDVWPDQQGPLAVSHCQDSPS